MRITTDIPLASSQIGLALKAALVTDGDTVDSTYRNLTGFKNLGPSIYYWEYTIPDTFTGVIIFYTGTITVDNLLDNEITVKASMTIGADQGAGGTGQTEVLP